MPFTAHPWLTFVVGALFIGLWAWCRLAMPRLAAASWFVYGGYEYLMQEPAVCSGICASRIDLVFLYPLLLAVSVAALWQAWARRGRSA